jgi:hypothetical protein
MFQNVLKMSSSNHMTGDDLSQRVSEHEIELLQRHRARAHAEFVRGREALNMRELIDDFEDFSFMQQRDMRRNQAHSMRMNELHDTISLRQMEAHTLNAIRKTEEYHMQQEQEGVERIAALRFAREHMQQNAVRASNFPSPLATGYLCTNVEGFSDNTQRAVLLHEQLLRERALVSAHAERIAEQKVKDVFIDFSTERSQVAVENRLATERGQSNVDSVGRTTGHPFSAQSRANDSTQARLGRDYSSFLGTNP